MACNALLNRELCGEGTVRREFQGSFQLRSLGAAPAPPPGGARGPGLGGCNLGSGRARAGRVGCTGLPWLSSPKPHAALEGLTPAWERCSVQAPREAKCRWSLGAPMRLAHISPVLRQLAAGGQLGSLREVPSHLSPCSKRTGPACLPLQICPCRSDGGRMGAKAAGGY